jgi:hypothetical protein
MRTRKRLQRKMKISICVANCGLMLSPTQSSL